jgi:hypothetical protein
MDHFKGQIVDIASDTDRTRQGKILADKVALLALGHPTLSLADNGDIFRWCMAIWTQFDPTTTSAQAQLKDFRASVWYPLYDTIVNGNLLPLLKTPKPKTPKLSMRPNFAQAVQGRTPPPSSATSTPATATLPTPAPRAQAPTNSQPQQPVPRSIDPEATAAAHVGLLAKLDKYIDKQSLLLGQLKHLIPAIWGPKGSPQRLHRAALLQDAQDAWITPKGLIVVKFKDHDTMVEYLHGKAVILGGTGIGVHSYSHAKPQNLTPPLQASDHSDLASEFDAISSVLQQVYNDPSDEPLSDAQLSDIVATAMDTGNGVARREAPPTTSPPRATKRTQLAPSLASSQVETGGGGGASSGGDL